MDNLVTQDRTTRRRWEAFHQKCKSHCDSKTTFMKKFHIDKGHVAKGYLKNPEREFVSNEDIAAIIKYGRLNYGTCSERSPIKIAIEGEFFDFQWTEYGAGKVNDIKVDAVTVRVVIREASPKNVVVTVYVMPHNRTSDSKEVSREIW